SDVCSSIISQRFVSGLCFGRSIIIYGSPLGGLPWPFLWVFSKYIVVLGSGVGGRNRVFTQKILHHICCCIGNLPRFPVTLGTMHCHRDDKLWVVKRDNACKGRGVSIIASIPGHLTSTGISTNSIPIDLSFGSGTFFYYPFHKFAHFVSGFFRDHLFRLCWGVPLRFNTVFINIGINNSGRHHLAAVS